MRKARTEGDDVHALACLCDAEHFPVMRDVEGNRLPFRTPDEGEATRGIDGKAARALAAVRPPRGDGSRTEIDGERRVVPRVGISAMARQIDLERLRPVRHF